MKRLIIVLCVTILVEVLSRYIPSEHKTTNFIHTSGIQTEGVQFIKEYYKRG